jgi:hypothetical protein
MGGTPRQRSQYQRRPPRKDALKWGMRSRGDRFRGRFSDDGNVITGRWEQLDEDKSWKPWMEITLTRT